MKIISLNQQSRPNWIDFVEQNKNHPNGFVKLKNVKIIKPCGLILNQDNLPINTTLNEFVYWQPKKINLANFKRGNTEEVEEKIAEALKVAKTAPKERCLTLNSACDFVYLMHCFGWYAYGHLFDTLQRLYPLKELELFSPQYLCSDSKRVKDFNVHLEILGIPQQSLLFFYRWDVIEVPNLCVGFSPSVPTQFTVNTMEWIQEKYIHKNNLLQNYVAHRKIPNKKIILYLDRNNMGRRGVINNSQVLNALKSIGMEVIIFSGQETLLETLYLFNTASIIVGAHGAAFINTLFANRDSLILEFCPENRLVKNIAHMLKPATQHFLIQVQSNEKHEINIDIDFMLDLIKNYS